jgi:predicted DsbA family dithiol-disulfide isomerase
MPAVRITEFTDPGCPWAYSAEPHRRRLRWLYGDDLEWQVRMVVLADSPGDYVERGFTPDKQAAAYRAIARDHGMPIDTRERPRMAATRPACRAVVAARLYDPQAAAALLRCLRVHNFAGDALLDEPEMLELAATSAGLDGGTLARWLAAPGVDAALPTTWRPRGSPCAPPACSITSSPTGPAGAGTPARRTRSRAWRTA